MDNLIFSLNATVPVFLLMLLGMFFHKIGWMDDKFASSLNKYVFRIALPVLVFKDLAVVDFASAWDGKFVLFCFGVTVLSIVIASLVAMCFKEKSIRGEFIQSSYRSSAALLGIAFIQNIYGTSGMAPMMIIGSVPLYNIFAVIVLELYRPKEQGASQGDTSSAGKHSGTGQMVKETAIGIVTNPILIGIAVGMLWSALRIPLGGIALKTVNNLAGTATPLGLMAMGATFDIRKAFGKAKPAMVAAFIKLVGLAALFLPIAIAMGFREERIIAILVMLGSATTVSCFVMAKNMGHEGVVSSSVIMLTTMLSAFTLTAWLWFLRSMGYC